MEQKKLEIIEITNKDQIEELKSLITKLRGKINDLLPLHLSISFNSKESFNFLLQEHLIDINQIDKDGNTPLHLCCSLGRIDMTKAILEIRHVEINDNVKNFNEQTALDICINEDTKNLLLYEMYKYRDKCYELMEHGFSQPTHYNLLSLLMYYVNIFEPSRKELLVHVKENEIGYLKTQVDNHQINYYRSNLLDINYQSNKNGKTILHIASQLSIPNYIAIVLELGAQVTIKDFDLKLASDYCNNNEIKQLLLHNQGSLDGMLEGKLLKWTNFKNGYQERYFLLHSGILEYYLSPLKQDLRGKIKLNKCKLKLDTKDMRKFEIQCQTTSQQQSWYLKAITKEECKNWIFALTQAIELPNLTIMSPSYIRRNRTESTSSYNGKPPSINFDLSKQMGRARSNTLTDLIPSRSGRSSPTMSVFSYNFGSEPDVEDSIEEDVLHNDQDLMEFLDSLNLNEANLVADRTMKVIEEKFKWNAITIKKIPDPELQASILKIEHDVHVELIALVGNLNAKYLNHVTKLVNHVNLLRDKNDAWGKALDTVIEEQKEMIEQLNSSIKTDEKGQLESSEEEYFDFDHPEPQIDQTRPQFEYPGYTGPIRTQFSNSLIEAPKVDLWAFIKASMGKDWSKLSVPVLFNEPISLNQRCMEELEFSHLLDLASLQSSSMEKCLWIAAFVISFLPSFLERKGKPFNSLVGETYEFMDPNLQLRYFSERVQHQPPIIAYHAQNRNFKLEGALEVECSVWPTSLTMKAKHRNHIYLKSLYSHQGSEKCEHFSYSKPDTVCGFHNGKLDLYFSNSIQILNHNTNEKIEITFLKDPWFSKSGIRRFKGQALNVRGEVVWDIFGNWDSHFTIKRPDNHTSHTTGFDLDAMKLKELLKLTRYQHLSIPTKIAKLLFNPDSTNSTITLWKANPLIAQRSFGLPLFCVKLNHLPYELDKYLPPTDSRLRVDQQAFEEQDYDRSDDLKAKLEELQRERRSKSPYQPTWFSLKEEPDTKCLIWSFNKEYWQMRLKNQALLVGYEGQELEKQREKVWHPIQAIFKIK